MYLKTLREMRDLWMQSARRATNETDKRRRVAIARERSRQIVAALRQIVTNTEHTANAD